MPIKCNDRTMVPKESRTACRILTGRYARRVQKRACSVPFRIYEPRAVVGDAAETC